MAADLHGAEPRYRMLETVREYAAELLAADPAEAARVRRRHAEHYLALAEASEPQLTRGAQDQWLAILAAEYDNLRAALGWCRDEPAPELCARLAAALTPYWLERSQWSECRLWLDAAARSSQLPPLLHARILNGRCYLEYGPAMLPWCLAWPASRWPCLTAAAIRLSKDAPTDSSAS